MIYITGDIHGSPVKIEDFCRRFQPDENDIIIILGDVGLNYYGGSRDRKMKEKFSMLKPTILCIHGNHENRPENISEYVTKRWNGGIVRYEEKYPNILFAEDGNVFTIDEKRYFVIGGAYSVDKFYRLVRGFGWWADEQPSDAVKSRVEAVVAAQPVDYVLSHTCPFKYEPVEVFLPGIDQSTVDDSTERWLDEIEEKLDYTAWYCGHWHIDKRIDRMHFLFNSFVKPEQDRGKGNE